MFIPIVPNHHLVASPNTVPVPVGKAAPSLVDQEAYKDRSFLFTRDQFEQLNMPLRVSPKAMHQLEHRHAVRGAVVVDVERAPDGQLSVSQVNEELTISEEDLAKEIEDRCGAEKPVDLVCALVALHQRQTAVIQVMTVNLMKTDSDCCHDHEGRLARLELVADIFKYIIGGLIALLAAVGGFLIREIWNRSSRTKD